MTDKDLDKVDKQMLRALQDNARLTIKELAGKVSLSQTPVYDRFKRLEENGYIKKYAAILDEEKLNCGFKVFCNVKMSKINADISAKFNEAIQKMPEVTECYNISGNFDFLLKINVGDMKSYRDFIMNGLGLLDNVSSIESVFVMNEMKRTYSVNLQD